LVKLSHSVVYIDLKSIARVFKGRNDILKTLSNVLYIKNSFQCF
jgi:hypothetical protein